MVIDAAKIAQMELALAEARLELMQEDGKRYAVIIREISVEEKQRILDSLTDRKERILFGLEAPERAERPAKSGGDLTCPICGKTGLTRRGLALHTVRKHKDEQGRGESTEDMVQPAQASFSRRRSSRSQDTAETAETGVVGR